MRVLVEYDVPVPMSDGVVLATDIFRPASSERYPAILARTPYGKLTQPPGLALNGSDPLALVRAGYVVLLQDVRGTGASGGAFQALRDDGIDGAATVAWAAAQPWSDGGVAMVGGSYLGAAQVLAAEQRPEALRAITPAVAFGPEGLSQGGAFRLGLYLLWASGMAQAELLRQEAAGEDVNGMREQVEQIGANLADAYRRLPLLALADASPWLDGTYGHWLRHPEGDEFWRQGAVTDRCASFAIPALHITGWYDHHVTTSLATYQALRASAATEHARDNQHLIVTPWGHTLGGPTSGELWLGTGAGANFSLFDAHLAWFNRWLKGEQLEDERVQLFVQGVNSWRSEPDWPLARAVPTQWYLHAGGTLSREVGSDGESAEFVYDPRNPVPTIGGQGGVGGPDGILAVGPRDRRTLHRRPDVLLYVSDVLHEEVEVTGPVTATLHVASSALDTDFTAALIDVFPDGRAIVLTEGILRLRYRNGMTSPQLLERNRVYQIEIDLVATSNVFLTGHRIALEISSSNFPRFDRNPNHGGVIAEATESDFVEAVQKVFHDANRASYVTLPVVPAR